MSRDELQPTAKFIEAFKKRDLLKIHSIFHKELYQLMDNFSRNLTNELITRISPSRPVNQSEFKEILNDKSIDELERRKQLFEWFQTSAKKNKLTFETL